MAGNIRIVAELEDKLSKDLRELTRQTNQELEGINSKLKSAKNELDSLTRSKANSSRRNELQETISNLKREYDAITKNERAEERRYKNTFKYELQKRLEVEKTASKVAQSASREVIAQEKVTHGNYKEDASRRALSTSIVRHIRQLESLAVAYYSLTSAYNATFGAGVKLNRQYETGSLGIAAILASKTSMVNANGVEANGYEKLKAMQTLTSDIMDKIKKAELETPASFEQMVGFYQQAIGHALASGKAFGNNLSEISDNTILLTKRMSNIGSSMGMSMDRINEEIRSLMSGNASSDSMIAMMLFGSPSKANDAVKEAKKRVGGLTELFNGVMSPYDALANTMTFDKALARLQGTIASVQKEASKPLFDDMFKGLQDLQKYVDQNKDELVTSFQVMYAQAKVAGEGISTVGGVIFDSLADAGKAIGLIIDLLSDDLPSASREAAKQFNVFDYAVLGISTFAEAIKIIAKTFPLYMRGMTAEVERIYYKTMYYANKIKDFVDPTSTGADTGYYKYQMNVSGLESRKLDAQIGDVQNGSIDALVRQYNSLIKARDKKTSVKNDSSKDSMIADLMARIKLLTGGAEEDAGGKGGKTGKSDEQKEAEKQKTEWEKIEKEMDDSRKKFIEDRGKALDKEIEDGIRLEKKLVDETKQASMDKYEYATYKLKEEYEEYKKTQENKVAVDEWFKAKTAQIASEKLKDEQDKLKENMIELKTVYEDAFKSMEDAMVKMFMTGKFSAQDFFNTIIEGMIRMQIRNSITAPLMQAMSGINFGSIFSFGSGAVNPASASEFGIIDGVSYGGFASGGYTGAGGRNDVAGIVHRGEYVIPQWMTNKSPALIESLERVRLKGYADGGLVGSTMAQTSSGVVVNVTNNSGTPVSADNVNTRFDAGQMVVDIVIDAITRNKGGARDVIRGVR